MKFILKTALFMLVCINVVAQEELPTKMLLDMCKNENDAFRYGICIGGFADYSSSEVIHVTSYMAGAIDILKIYDQEVDSEKLISVASKRIEQELGCVKGKHPEQLAKVFIKWAEANPELWDQAGIISINQAFRELLPPPCK